jgi:quinohemoprotein amine dehydrogenase
MVQIARLSLTAAALTCAVMAASAFQTASAQSAEGLLNARCSACHVRTGDGGLSRISQARKTPEGWDMTIVRMMLVHGVQVSADERHLLVKHLADTQGLAPSESASFRYALERRPDVVDEAPNEDLATVCARCHGFARVGLQRRDEAEWSKLGHFHLGQFPTAEYQALGRDRDWLKLATEDMPKALGGMYPLRAAAWDAWKNRSAPDLSGSWRIVGRRAGYGSYEGRQEMRKSGKDRYAVTVSLRFADGTTRTGSGDAILYTGYEWRARLSLGGEEILQVMAVSEDGNEISGRWFNEAQDVLGGNQLAVRGSSKPRVLAVEPGYIRQGERKVVSISGVNLSGKPDLGDGVRVVEMVSADRNSVVVEVQAGGKAATGSRNVSVGDAGLEEGLVVYDQLGSLRVEPAETIARVGGGGGPIPAVPAQFEAVGYMNGPDGQAGTDDDVRIGVMPATWRADNFDDLAARMKDAAFAGNMDAEMGLFAPATAGPNPLRPYGTNNLGNLSITATVEDDGRKVEGQGHLFVTVQRFVDPPIR